MDPYDVFMTALRRWYITVPIVALAIAAAVVIAEQQQPVYRGTAGYALVPKPPANVAPVAPDASKQSNPLAADNARVLGEALVADLMQRDTQQVLGSPATRGFPPGGDDDGSSYVVARPEGSQSYLVEAWGTDVSTIRAVLTRVLDAAPRTTATIQSRAGATPASWFSPFVTNEVQVVALPLPSRTKLVVGLGALGLMAGAAGAVLLERARQRRRTLGRELDGIPHDAPPPAGEVDPATNQQFSPPGSLARRR